MTCGAWSGCRARTGSSRSCRTTASTQCGFIRKLTAARRPSTLTTASSITQTGMLPRRARRLRRPSEGGCAMSGTEAVPQDDQSHYEISLTAGQAFLAFVLLLLSLAASFAFGLIVGRGQGDDRLVVRKEPSVVTEASVLPKKQDAGRIVELGVSEEEFKAPATQTSS